MTFDLKYLHRDSQRGSYVGLPTLQDALYQPHHLEFCFVLLAVYWHTFKLVGCLPCRMEPWNSSLYSMYYLVGNKEYCVLACFQSSWLLVPPSHHLESLEQRLVGNLPCKMEHIHTLPWNSILYSVLVCFTQLFGTATLYLAEWNLSTTWLILKLHTIVYCKWRLASYASNHFLWTNPFVAKIQYLGLRGNYANVFIRISQLSQGLMDLFGSIATCASSIIFNVVLET